MKVGSFLKRAAVVAVGVAAVFAAGEVGAATITVGPSGKDYTDVIAAVTAAKTAIAGGEESVTITVAEGEYVIADQIDLDGPITISGAGMGKTVIRRDTSKSIRIAYLHHADAVIEKATLRDGYISTGPAGGALVEAGSLIDCEFINCGICHWDTSKGYGDGSCVRVTGASSRAIRCYFHDINEKYSTCLALYVANQGVADSCLITGNSASNGSAGYFVYVNGGTLRNCTVTDNYNANKITAVYVANSANTRVIDCVIYGNRGIQPVAGSYGNGHDLTVQNAAAWARCENTVVEDPGFVNADIDDFRLCPSSPHVDSGSDGSESISAFDFTGVTPRKCDNAVDAGAYEAVRGTTPSCNFTCSERVKLQSEVFTLGLYNANGGDDCTYTLDWGDGAIEQVKGPTATHAYATSGSFTVSLSIPGSETYTRTGFLTARPKNLYLSHAGSATAPYDTPEKATSSIEDAVAAAANGSVIWVAPDTTPYAFTKEQQLCIRDRIQVRGQTGDPAQVVLTPKTANKHRMFLLGNKDAGLYNLTIQGGYAETSQIAAGDCVYIESTGGTVSNCVLRNVSDTKWGNVAAGICMQAGLVTHCVLSNLYASTEQEKLVGMVANLSGGSMENCLITRNVGRGLAKVTSGGIVALSGSARLVNCTIAGNQMDGPSGVYLQSTTAQVINCLIGENKSLKMSDAGITTYVGCNSYGTAIDVTDCFTACAAEVAINGTCYTGNLGFKDAVNYDYHIIVGSTARDHGVLPSGYQPPTVDLDGAARADDGKIDIGCYELHISGIASSFTASAKKGAVPCEVTFTATVEGADPNSVTYKWDVFGDGSEIVTTQVPTLVYTYQAFGNFTVKLTVEKGGESYPAVNTAPFYAYPKDLYVDAKSASPEAPYNVPGKAAKTLADAFAEASDGSDIHIAADTYLMTECLQVDKGISFVGATGKPEDVVLKPSGNVARPFLLNHADARICNVAISGFTYGNYSHHGKGVYIDNLGGTVSNCVIRGCEANAWGAMGGGIYMDGPGLVTHCVISNCQASTYSDRGSTSAIAMKQGTVRNCLIADNRVSKTEDGSAVGGTVSVRGGVVDNCTLARNTSRVCAGINCESGGLVRNCVIAGGTSTAPGQPATAAAWGGTAANFANCVVDTESPNATCTNDTAPFVSVSVGDFHLASGSAALDFGQKLDWMDAGATDLDGEKRIDGDAPDAGCYEAKAGVFSASFKALTPTEGFAPITVDFAVSVTNDGGAGVTCRWYDGDATEPLATTDELSYRFVRTDFGKSDIRLVVTDKATGTPFEVPGHTTVYAAPQTIYVVPSEAEVTSQAPYASWATAAKTLPDAYASAIPGATILLSNGVYRVGGQLLVNTGVTISGIDAKNPEAIRLRTEGNGSRVFYLDHPEAAVKDLTLEGYYTGTSRQTRGGLVYINDGGAVLNCILRKGEATAWEGLAGAIYMKTGLLSRCVITNCSAGACSGSEQYENCKGIAVHMRGGRMENCLLADNRVRSGDYADLTGGAVYLAGGEVVNCTVVSNTFPGCAGVYAEGGRVVNTIIADNVSTVSGGEASVWRGDITCFDHCVSDSLAVDGRIIRGDPCFRDVAKRDWRITMSSAARNVGDDSAVTAATDLSGRPRKIGRVDAGCYECQSGGFVLIVR